MITPIHPDDAAAALADAQVHTGASELQNRRTLGRGFPTRRTLGRGLPTRRTLGRRGIPTRRTLGRGLPTRRTLG